MVNFITAYIRTNMTYNRPLDEATTMSLINQAMNDPKFINHLMESDPNIRVKSDIVIDDVAVIKITNELNIGG